MIQEIEVTENKAHVSIDGKEYLVLSSPRSVTVIVGRWIRDRRSIGTTFWEASQLRRHYKKHGAILEQYATKLCPALATVPTAFGE